MGFQSKNKLLRWVCITSDSKSRLFCSFWTPTWTAWNICNLISRHNMASKSLVAERQINGPMLQYQMETFNTFYYVKSIVIGRICPRNGAVRGLASWLYISLVYTHFQHLRPQNDMPHKRASGETSPGQFVLELTTYSKNLRIYLTNNNNRISAWHCHHNGGQWPLAVNLIGCCGGRWGTLDYDMCTPRLWYIFIPCTRGPGRMYMSWWEHFHQEWNTCRVLGIWYKCMSHDGNTFVIMETCVTLMGCLQVGVLQWEHLCYCYVMMEPYIKWCALSPTLFCPHVLVCALSSPPPSTHTHKHKF